MAGNLPPFLSHQNKRPYQQLGTDTRLQIRSRNPPALAKGRLHVDHWLLPSVIISLEFIPGPKSRPYGGLGTAPPQETGVSGSEEPSLPKSRLQAIHNPKIKEINHIFKAWGGPSS